MAIFDAILISMMNKIDLNSWQGLRNDICQKLNKRKTERTIEILEKSYSNSDIFFLQEVASSFKDKLENAKLSNFYNIYYPFNMESDRDQNSFILLKKNVFSNVTEITKDILKEVKGNAVAPGKLLSQCVYEYMYVCIYIHIHV
jgi:hypothetical protein